MSETLKELPQLQQVEVDDALLDALVTDLTALTEILCVMPKAGAFSRPLPAAWSSAQHALLQL